MKKAILNSLIPISEFTSCNLNALFGIFNHHISRKGIEEHSESMLLGTLKYNNTNEYIGNSFLLLNRFLEFGNEFSIGLGPKEINLTQYCITRTFLSSVEILKARLGKGFI